MREERDAVNVTSAENEINDEQPYEEDYEEDYGEYDPFSYDEKYDTQNKV